MFARYFINFSFVKMHEAGIVKRNEENLLPLKFKQQIEEYPSSVCLKKTLPIFIIFTVGILMAMLLLLLEILAYKTKQKVCLSKNTYSHLLQTTYEQKRTAVRSNRL
jgi:hypothetical protein